MIHGCVLKPLQLAIVGTGGFSLFHHRILRRLEEESECRLLCTCDPSAENLALADKELSFSGRGVKIFRSLEELLQAHASELDGIILPTPLPLHAEMHAACVQAGVPCYLEKPPTLYLPEYEEMMSVEQDAKIPTQIGFNYCENKTRKLICERMATGEFGKLHKVSFEGLWPRGAKYYQRSSWAGRLALGDKPVLDSCLGNAFSHFVVQLLRWARVFEDLDFMPSCSWVEAELYRVNSIESFDTVYVRSETNTGVKLVMSTSHACYPVNRNEEILSFEKATIVYIQGETATIYRETAPPETLEMDQGDSIEPSLRSFIKLLRTRTGAPVISLAECRPFVEFITLVFLAGSPIQNIHPDFWTSQLVDGDEFRTIKNLTEISSQFIRNEKFPSEMNVPWGRKTKLSKPDQLNTFDLASFVREQNLPLEIASSQNI